MADALSWLARFEAGSAKPVTFLERGVTLPFTTPQLLGARIRPGQRRAAELVLANPAGVEGVYILPWQALPDICTPTLHDRALWARVADLPLLTPRTVRAAAQAVAAEGHAGRAAARAAARAGQGADAARTAMEYRLMLELIRQGEGSASPPVGVPLPLLQQRARAVLLTRRGDASLAPARALESLAELADLFAPLGMAGDGAGHRLPELAARIVSVIEQVVVWAESAGPAERTCARLLAQGSALALRCYRVAIAEPQVLLDDLWTLIHRWQLQPEGILALVARPEWLLDGWDLMCGLWEGAGPPQRSVAILDMAALVPVIPVEVGEWVGFDAPGDMDTHRDGLRRWRRTVAPNQDWATGRILALTSRNEQVRAMAA